MKAGPVSVQCAVHVLFKVTTLCAEGVLQAEKDFNLPQHPEIPGVPNLQVPFLANFVNAQSKSFLSLHSMRDQVLLAIARKRLLTGRVF